jgi:hypothetical protein
LDDGHRSQYRRTVLDWRKLLLLTHRWLGIAGCILFVLWFFSGIVMMYARMPTFEHEERLARAPALDLSTAALSPFQAAEAIGTDAEGVQVAMLGDRPVYRFGGRNGLIVFADDGKAFEGLKRSEAEAVARRYAPGHQGPIRYDAYLTAPDQWTIQSRNEMPLHRFALDDAAGTELYVSDVTGDVELRTTRSERFWGYLGPVLHWLYFKPLRLNGPLWSDIVIWSSLVGCLMCVTGLLWGLLRFSPRGGYRIQGASTGSPYTGLLKWHHYAGLIFGLVTLTWTYSGLLSMGPFNWFQTRGMTEAQRTAAAGGPLRPEVLTLDSIRTALDAFAPAFRPKELELVQFRGESFWSALQPPAPEQAAFWMNAGLLPRASRPPLERRHVSIARPGGGTFTEFDREAISQVARDAMPGIAIEDAVWLQEYDGYYYDPRASRPLPVLRVRYADPEATWLYLDPKRGAIVQRSERVGRLQRWLYQGFHSLDFPFLYFRRPLWDIVVIMLSIGGLVLSATTLVPAWRRLRRHASTLARWPLRAWQDGRARRLPRAWKLHPRAPEAPDA